MSYDAARIANEQGEEVELLWRELDRRPFDRHRMRHDVDGQWPDIESRFLSGEP